MSLVFVCLKQLLQLHILVHGLNLCHCILVRLAVVILENGQLLLVRALERLTDQPAALVVLNVGTNFANHGWIPIAVQDVVLNLEELPDYQADFAGRVEGALLFHAAQVQCTRRREVECVESGLPRDNQPVPVQGVVIEVDLPLGNGQHVHELPYCGCVGTLVEHLEDVYVTRQVGGVLLQHAIYHCLQDAAVVHGNQLHLLHLVPARLASSGQRVIHDVVCH
mmetsp:Transcript_36972/g.80541  ORF Transcript_36972/g.80541 Transcript_36972/m.80541 type:complete len:223 (+) Transcript_36972:184-852(+)